MTTYRLAPVTFADMAQHGEHFFLDTTHIAFEEEELDITILGLLPSGEGAAAMVTEKNTANHHFVPLVVRETDEPEEEREPVYRRLRQEVNDWLRSRAYPTSQIDSDAPVQATGAVFPAIPKGARVGARNIH